MSNPKLGFCCKFLPEDGEAETTRQMSTTTVTMASLGRLDPKAAYDKLAAVVAHNLEVAIRQIAHVASRPNVAHDLAWSDFVVEAKLKNITSEGWPSTPKGAGGLAE
jgi:hypothetical protein